MSEDGPGMWALVPVKRFDRAKSRLGPTFAARERARLARAMLLDVLDALRAANSVGGIAIVSHEPDVPGIAARYGAAVIDDPGDSDLSSAVTLALDWARDRSEIDALLVLPADVPLVRPADIDALAAAAGDTCAITPSADGSGTNAVVLRRPFRFDAQFGPGSFARHLAAFRRLRIDPIVHDAPRVAFDIDTADDLERLRAADDGTQTGSVLADILAGRDGKPRSEAG